MLRSRAVTFVWFLLITNSKTGIEFMLRVASRRFLSNAQSVKAAKALNARLDVNTDPELFLILEKEKQRQRNSLVLIASENYAPRRVLDTLGTVMSNKCG